MRTVLLIQAALLVLLVSGCIKRPVWLPDPPSAEDAGEPIVMVPRPSPREFSPVDDLKDIYFDFDRYQIRPIDVKVLDANVVWLKANADHALLIEGHCDERGSPEYNAALGQRRARATMDYLVSRGVPATRITIISYSEERPLCSGNGESCWSRNRRAHFMVRPE